VGGPFPSTAVFSWLVGRSSGINVDSNTCSATHLIGTYTQRYRAAQLFTPDPTIISTVLETPGKLRRCAKAGITEMVRLVPLLPHPAADGAARVGMVILQNGFLRGWLSSADSRQHYPHASLPLLARPPRRSFRAGKMSVLCADGDLGHHGCNVAGRMIVLTVPNRTKPAWIHPSRWDRGNRRRNHPVGRYREP